MIKSISQPADEVKLPPLRDELSLSPGPRAPDGSPTWTIQDPATGRFFRLGWMEFEVLLRWTLGRPSAIAEAIRSNTALRPTESDVRRFATQLLAANLLRPTTPQAVAQIAAQHEAARQMNLAWLALKNYLFFRLPLVRPDALLTALAEWMRWIFSTTFLVITLGAGVVGFLLALRQWDVFVASFPYLTTGEGIVLGLAALVLLKVLHECGHGLMAKRYGCHVRTAGVAFMLFVPMFYTDVSDAWRLKDRRQRVLIAVAGIFTELFIACWALLFWSLLPDGPLRSVAFVWATTTWILTLLVNANPLMRFDGYYILSDALDQPNLQDTAFALGRWHMRRILLGAQEPVPVTVARRRRRILIVYAYATWVFRFLLFMGIAAAVYLMSFKVLGILLAAVEIAWFILRPIWKEISSWRRLKLAQAMNPVMFRSFILLAGLVLLMVLPWRATVHGDALISAEKRVLLMAPAPGQVAEIAVRPGQRVEQSQVLFRVSSPPLEHEVGLHRLRIANLSWQIEVVSQQQESIARAAILIHERDAARQRLASAESALSQLVLRAPFDGEVVEVADPLDRLEWVERGEPLAMLVDRTTSHVEAFVAEQHIHRLAVGRMAQVQPRNPDLGAFAAVVEAIDTSATRQLPEVALASTHGGPIPARVGANNTTVPETPVYRVRLHPIVPIEVTRMELATVRIEADAESLFSRSWRHIKGVLIRESGF